MKLDFLDELFLHLSRGNNTPYLLMVPLATFNDILKQIEFVCPNFIEEIKVKEFTYKGCTICIHPENDFDLKIRKDEKTNTNTTDKEKIK